MRGKATKTAAVLVRLTPAEHKRLADHAKRTGETPPAVVRRLLSQHLYGAD